MSTENPDVYEVTCFDCNTTKSYFTSQGVTYFKMNHQGHNVRVKEGAAQKEEGTGAEAPEQEASSILKVAREQPLDEPPRREEERPTSEPPMEPVRLTSLVVDVVDNGDGKVVEVYGVAGGSERFSKRFYMRDLDTLNLFLEAGTHTDPSSLATFTWTPEKVDLSEEVAKMLDEPVAGVPEKSVETGADGRAAQKGEAARKVAPQQKAPAQVSAPTRSATEDVLLGKLSYVQPGEENRLESIRVSKVLRRFRWNTELPYVIGGLFDDLLSVQSQKGAIEGSLIEAVSKLGYTFVAVEAPSGEVTAWFRRDGAEEPGNAGNVPSSPPASGSVTQS